MEDLLATLTPAAELDELRAETVDRKTLAGLDTFLAAFQARLTAIPVGSRMVMGGGWMGKSSGHALLYILERESESSYAFVACNTGEGVRYHPSVSDESLLNRKRKTAIRIPNIPAEDFLDPAFWYMIWKIRVTNKEENSAACFYEVLLPALAEASTLVPDATSTAHILAADNDASSSGDYDYIQLSGTCYYRCIVSAIHYLNKANGLSRTVSDQIILLFRLAYLAQTQADLAALASRRALPAIDDVGSSTSLAALAQSLSFNNSDAQMVAMAVSETARTLVSLATSETQATSEHYPHASLLTLQAYIASVGAEGRAMADSSAAGAEPSDLPRPANPVPTPAASHPSSLPSGKLDSNVASASPFPGLDMVADERDTSVFAGGVTEAAPEMYVNLVPSNPEPPATLHQLATELQALATATQKLRFKTSHCADSLAVFQIAAAVEYAVATRFPLPPPPTSHHPAHPHPIYSAPGTVHPSLTSSAQHATLEAISTLALQYMSCSWSLSPDRSLDAARALTMAGLLVIYDAIVRMYPSDGPPHVLSSLLNGDTGDDDGTNGTNGSNPVVLGLLSFYSEPLAAISATSLLYRPHTLALRASVLSYIHAPQPPSAKTLFDWKPIPQQGPAMFRGMMDMPQFQVQEKDATLQFVASLLAATGQSFSIPPIPRGVNRGAVNPDAMSDVERQTRWFASDWASVPQFAWLRDLVFLFKLSLEPHFIFFLANEGLTSIPFWFSSHVRPTWAFFSANQEGNAATLRVSVGSVRHNLQLGVGQGVTSFASLRILAGRSDASEESILQAHALKSFDDTLSPQESELLLSYLIFQHPLTRAKKKKCMTFCVCE